MAHELFWQAIIPTKLGNQENLQILVSAASDWRNSNQYFSAGYAMSCAVNAAWGNGEQVKFCITAAIQDFQRCVENSPLTSCESLAALLMWGQCLSKLSRYFEVDRISLEGNIRSVLEELAQRLLTIYTDSPYIENYLVKGVQLKTDLDGKWKVAFPEFESHWGEQRVGRGIVIIDLPSAFHLFIALADYRGAQSVIDRCPNSFTTPGLKGWMHAVQGFLKSEEAPERFAEAASAFAEDVCPSDPEELMRRGSWSSINVDLWAKYFHSRSALARTVREPGRVKEIIQHAASYLEGTESGWVNKKVSIYRVLVQTLAQLISEGATLDSEQARQQFLKEARLTGVDADDTVMVQFLTNAAEAFEGFKIDPARELTTGRLSIALKALSRIPLIGAEIAGALEPAIGAIALEMVQGPVRTWIYRTLESIKDEKNLQKIILRLVQGCLPLYAQIRQGPLEYGKDVVVLIENGGKRILRMYQVKCGDITISKWRETRGELEEIFLVPLSKLQISDEVDLREAILVCNGHANPHAEPIMEGWFQEQKRVYGRDILFIHLDGLVNWVVKDRLINEFKAVLNEIGLKPVM